MFIKQLYTGCLSEAAYFIESGGEAAVIDPIRDTAAYQSLAEERNAAIKYIFETHFHADFISGHLDLAAKTNAPIVYGPGTKTGFPIHLAKDGEEFKIGKLTIQAIHTPGHTLESTCYLLKGEEGEPYCIFTGDTLFVGDVGRPDLFSGNLGKEELSGYLFDSLQKLKRLPDEVIVYPAHGPGSACGKNIGSSTSSTIGEQKRHNYAMLEENKEAFVEQVTDGLAEPPQYFPINAKINREGYAALEEVLVKGKKGLSIAAFREKVKNGALILDTRPGTVFAEGFVPGAVNIGLEGRFAEWVGVLMPYDRPIVLVTEEGKEEETIIRMARVGFDKVEGFLKGGFEAWKNAGEKTDLVINIEADELAMDMPFDQRLVVVDVRKPSEFINGHVKGARNIPVNDMTDPLVLGTVDDDHNNLYVHCQSGYRSMIACSLLKKEGIHNLRNVLGGFNKLKSTPGIKIVKEAGILN